MLEKTTLLIFSIFLLFISITAVCANDNATFDEFLSAEGEMIDDIRSPIDEEMLSSAPGSFNELSELVNGTDTVINLERIISIFLAIQCLVVEFLLTSL